MWIFTREGFYSVVEYDPKHDNVKDSVFKSIAKKKGTHVLVRARAKEHLEALRTVVPNLVIVSQGNADYKYRCVMPRGKWKGYLNASVDNIDYDSHFKEVVRDAQPKAMAQSMYSAMMSVWSTMGQLTWGNSPWWGSSSRSSKSSGTGGSKLDDLLSDDEWWDAHEARNFPYGLKKLRELVEERKSMHLSSEEVVKLNDAAYEVWQRVDDARKDGVDLSLEDILGLISEAEEELLLEQKSEAKND